MTFDKLPNEILDIIVSKISLVSDVLSLSTVCRRLYHLACSRLSQVNYLIYVSPEEHGETIIKKDALFYQTRDRNSLMSYVKNLPRLKVLEIHDACGPAAYILRDIFACRPDVIGVWFNYPFPSKLNRHAVSTAVIESMRSDSGEENDYRQLIIETVCKELWVVLPQMENIKRLHIEYYRADTLVGYNGLPFSNIEMLEIAVLGITNYYNQHYMLLIDNCPSLKSLFLSFIHCKEFQVVDHSKNFNLEDIVLEYEDESIQSWSSLGSFLHKYPNIKSIAIRGNCAFNDCHIRQLIYYWKRLEIVDVRGCDINKNSEEFVEKFNSMHRGEHQSNLSMDQSQNLTMIELIIEPIVKESILWPIYSTNHSPISHYFLNRFLRIR
ncbi:uncharacterized protein LOC128390329 [Panonychus citri]|uniref:uncharacterized protein LOC128390329 n=1 Tax=Panonychus citri TaxID=50023 RepID=UPI002307465D|nr:uncharacterized protein LOC128390329 [Panonychus citri]